MKAASSLERWFVDHVPAAGVPMRLARAAVAAVSPRRATYSQHGEDVWLFEQIRSMQLSPNDIYVDVGANHPTRISNTYLLYRRGFRGVVIEPNAELLRLHRMVRPRDVALAVGCGAQACVAKFHVTNAPVSSSFKLAAVSKLHRVVRTEYVPVLRLDDILRAVEHRYVSLLSIDTEGLDAEVLDGAIETLVKTRFVCVEVFDPASEDQVRSRLSGSFECIRQFGCNLIWRNIREI